MMVASLTGLGLQSARATEDFAVKTIPGNFSELAQKVRPGVVNIRTVKTIKGGGRVFKHFFGGPFGGNNNPFEEFFGPFRGNGGGRDFKQRSLGSGFIIDRDGYIVTNNHVIEGADQIRVKLADGQEFDAKLVGRDPKTDLALIKIAASKDLVPLEMGNSDALKVGKWVLAIGSPFGLEQTVTAGIVSAKGRTIGAGPYDDFIQTDASINPGNSGGPLINMKGKVIGINTAIVPNGQGIGFAIPINMANGIIGQLQDAGTVTRGWLGVGIQDLTPDLAEYYGLEGQKGALVIQVYDDDPADKGGIRSDDIIIAVDGKEVSSARDLSRIIADTPVEKRVPIMVIRNGKKKTVHVNLTKREEGNQAAGQTSEKVDDMGLIVMDLRPEAARQLGYNKEEKGVVIKDVRPGSKGSLAGIQRGDLIKEINHTQIKKVKDYNKRLEKIKPGEMVRILIKRRNAGFIVIRISK